MRRDERRIILTMTDYYLPGYKGGGPIRSISNLVAVLGESFDFRILTRDRDLGDSQPYTAVQNGTWAPVGAALVRYLAPEDRIVDAAQTCDHDVLYLNSFFSTLSVQLVLARWRGELARTPLIVAPRGEFYPSALALKAAKKRAYLTMAKALRLYRDVQTWQASNEEEAGYIRRIFPKATVRIVPDLPTPFPDLMVEKPPRTEGLHVVFLGRVARNKNLDYALRLLAGVDFPLVFHIYGPQQDPAYWETCAALMRDLPPHIEASYKGELAPDAVIPTLARYHALLFPTQGENFGYVIHEALAAGVLPVISDRTPWQPIENVLWTLPLGEPSQFVEALRMIYTMDNSIYQAQSDAAVDTARRMNADNSAVQATHRLFEGSTG
ncbi:MAG: hypothetical protein OHK0046_09570 [Anaerolineae bacterium]